MATICKSSSVTGEASLVKLSKIEISKALVAPRANEERVASF